ncbi:MAG: DUF2470 domain-containing protein [Opitutaceae bacterium]|jgi:hypothetical protein|nr:DUF2470 domain-containing protein [Opitutaceae bacterium]
MTTATAPVLTPSDRDRIVGHMNDDHADAVLAYARHFGARHAATAATLAGIDAEGMDLVVTEPSGDVPVRIPFDTALTGAHDAHVTLIRMAKQAASAGASSGEAAAEAKRTAALERARAASRFLQDTLRTCQLATTSAEGEPDCSVAPWVIGPGGDLFTYLSELSRHTTHLRVRPRASVLLVEDESTAGHLLARRRLTLSCTATFMPRDHTDFAPAMEGLRDRFGPVMEHLEKMHDFHLVRLSPVQARLVAGFGQAYDADPRDWTVLSHVNDQGHRKS